MKLLKNLAVAALVVLGLLVLGGILIHRSLAPQPPPPPSPPSEARAPLLKRFPFLGDFQKASWVGGVRDNRGPLAPSSYFVRAYVVLRPEQTEALLARYHWVSTKTIRIPDPGYSLPEGFPAIAGAAMKADDLVRALPSMTTFSGGVILFQPQDNLLFLDLVNN